MIVSYSYLVSTASGITTEKIYKVTTYNINNSALVYIRIMLQKLSVRTTSCSNSFKTLCIFNIFNVFLYDITIDKKAEIVVTIK